MEQLRQVHVVAIHRINDWEKKISAILGYPVFFYWNERAYLLNLSETDKNNEKEMNHFKEHIQIHEMFLNTRSSTGADLEEESLRILKQSKARELELILNLPSFAHVKA